MQVEAYISAKHEWMFPAEKLLNALEYGLEMFWLSSVNSSLPSDNHRMLGVGRDLCGSSSPSLSS